MYLKYIKLVIEKCLLSYFTSKMFFNFCKVTTLVNRYKSLRKSGKSKTAHQLVQEINVAIDRLIHVGRDIAKNSPDIADEMLQTCHDTKKAGN